jgi:hypothetical protein
MAANGAKRHSQKCVAEAFFFWRAAMGRRKRQRDIAIKVIKTWNYKNALMGCWLLWRQAVNNKLRDAQVGQCR